MLPVSTDSEVAISEKVFYSPVNIDSHDDYVYT